MFMKFTKSIRNKFTIIILSLISLLLFSNTLFTYVLIDVKELQDINLNLDDLKIEHTLARIQVRDEPNQFKLIDYPIGEMGHSFDVEFLRETGFIRSNGIEISTENSNICSVILEFEGQGAQESYYQVLAFLSIRERHDCFPYVWVPKWNDVTDMLNHFIFAIQHTYPTELSDIGSEASWLYDPFNNFYYVVFYDGNFLAMVGETGSLDNAIKYAKIIENRVKETKFSYIKTLTNSFLGITLTLILIIYFYKNRDPNLPHQCRERYKASRTSTCVGGTSIYKITTNTISKRMKNR